MRLSRIGRPRMCVSRTRTSRTRVSAMRTSQTSPTRARAHAPWAHARTRDANAASTRRGLHAAHAPATHIPSSTHKRRPSLFAPPAIPGRHDARLPRARQPHRLRPPAFRRRVGAGTGCFCRALSRVRVRVRVRYMAVRSAARSTASPPRFIDRTREIHARNNPSGARRRQSMRATTRNGGARLDAPAGREAPGGKARGRGHIAAGTSARATPRAAPVTRLARGTRCSRPPARSVTLAPTLIPAPALAPARHTPSVAARRAARSPRRAVDCERASAARIASRHALSHRVDASQRAGPSVIRSYFHARAMRAAAPAGIGYTGRL